MASDVFTRLHDVQSNLKDTISSLHSRTKTPDEIPELQKEPEDISTGLTDAEELTAPGAEEPIAEPIVPEEAPEAPEEVPEAEEDTTEASEDTIEKVAEPEVEAPEKRIWKPIDSPNGKYLRFQSDKEGVVLDIRMLSVDPRVWLARLQRGGKLLDWGTILIPKDIRDPMAYIKAISDAMLDVKSMRYEQEWQKKYAEAQGIDLTPTPPPTPEEAPPEEEAPEGEEGEGEEGGEEEGGEDILAGLGL